jgi:hypothetical protein
MGRKLGLATPSHTSEIRQSSVKYAGFLGQWDERLIDQASDVPSIIFFS